MKLREYYPIDHVKMENGFLFENCNSGDELMNIIFRQVSVFLRSPPEIQYNILS